MKIKALFLFEVSFSTNKLWIGRKKKTTKATNTKFINLLSVPEHQVYRSSFQNKSNLVGIQGTKTRYTKNANLVPKYKKYKIESQVHVTLLLQLCGHFTSMVNEADMSTQSVFSFTRHNRHGTSNIRYDMYLSRQYGSHVPCTSFLKIHKGLYI